MVVCLVEDATGGVEVQLHLVAHAQVRKAHLPRHAVPVVVSVVLYGRQFNRKLITFNQSSGEGGLLEFSGGGGRNYTLFHTLVVEVLCVFLDYACWLGQKQNTRNFYHKQMKDSVIIILAWFGLEIV